MSKRLTMLTEEEFSVRLYRNPVEALREVKADFRANEESHTEALCRIIQRATHVYSHMEGDERQIEDFYHLRFWSGRTYRPNKKNLLLHCMQYVVGAIDTESPNYKRAHDYKTAAEILIDMGLTYKDMYSELVDAGGPYALLGQNNDAVINRRPNEDGSSNGLGDQVDNIRTEKPRSQGLFQLDQPGSVEKSNKKASDGDTQGRPRRLSIVRIFEKDKHIAITAGDYMNHFFEMTEGETSWLLVERVKDEGKFSRYEVQGVKPHND